MRVRSRLGASLASWRNWPRRAVAWRYADVIILAVLALAVMAINLWWRQAETRPPHWDMARHLWTSLLYWKLAESHRVLPLLQEYHYYPPLVYWLVIPFYKIWGTGVAAAVASNVVYVGALVGSTYAIGRRLGGRLTGLLAAGVVVSYPMLVTQFKEFQLDAPLTAVVALALCLLLYSEAFRRPGYTLAFGAVSGIGMLTKWTFVACLALPAVVAFGAAVAADWKARAPQRLAIIAVAALVAYAICSPWYAANIQQFRIDMHANGAPQALAEGDPAVGTLAANLYYLNDLVNQQLFLPGFLLFVGGAVWAAWRRRSFDLLLLGAAIIGIYAIFTLLPNKDPRYSLPMLPAVAVLAVAWVGALRGRWRLLSASLLALYSLGTFTIISFGVPWLPSTLSARLGTAPITVFSQQGYLIGAPTHENWGLPDVAAYLACQPAGQRSLAYSGPDTIWLNAWDLQYYQQRGAFRLTDQQSAIYLLERRDESALRSDALLRRTLPDGTVLSLYKR